LEPIELSGVVTVVAVVDSVRDVSRASDDSDSAPLTVVVVAVGSSQIDRVVGAPSEGNSVSRTVHAAAVPPTAVQQYSNQPTNALVRRRGPRPGPTELEPPNTSPLDTPPAAELLIIGRSPSAPP
jgi:hypothetical protein